MATNEEILNDIQNIYKKVDQCYRAKEELNAQIIKEQGDIIGLRQFMQLDEERIIAGKKPRFEKESMLANIQRLKNNIELFKDTITKEDKNIEKFREIVKVLQDDINRPKELIIDMTGK